MSSLDSIEGTCIYIYNQIKIFDHYDKGVIFINQCFTNYNTQVSQRCKERLTDAQNSNAMLKTAKVNLNFTPV